MVETIDSTKQKLDDGEQASVAKSVDAANLKFASPWLAGSNPAARTNQQTRGSAMIDRTYLFRSAGYTLRGAKWQRPLSRAQQATFRDAVRGPTMQKHELFRRAAFALHGSEWLRRLPHSLHAYQPRGLPPTTGYEAIYDWADGRQPIPDWVLMALADLLDKAAPDIDAHLDEAQSRFYEMRNRAHDRPVVASEIRALCCALPES